MNSSTAAYAAAQAQAIPVSSDINIVAEKAEKSNKTIEVAAQKASDSKNELEADEMASPVKAQKKLSSRTADVQKSEKSKRVQESVLVRKEEADGLAGDFNKKNPNYFLNVEKFSSLAQQLAEKIGELRVLNQREANLATGSLLKMVRDNLANGTKPADPSQVDKALEFLIEIADTVIKDPALTATIQAAREANAKQFKVEIKTGEKLIQMQEQTMKETGTKKIAAGSFDDIRNTLKTPEELVGTFDHFEKNKYTLEQKVKHFKSVLGYVREEVKTPSITFEDRAVMHTLMNAARMAQAGLSEMAFFKKNQGFIYSQVQRWNAVLH